MAATHRPPHLRTTCDTARLPKALARCFIELSTSDELERHCQRLVISRVGRGRTLLHRVLCLWMSDYDVNALLRMYPMHLLSTAQARQLLGVSATGRLLDVGAGSGDVTHQLAPLFDEVVATELSKNMARRLARRGYKTFEVDVARQGAPDPPYQVVSCLNVLDRCLLPLSLLRQCRNALAPDGRLLLSVPLPFAPHAYAGGRSVDPLEALDLEADSWEGAAALMVERVLEPLGLRVERWSRLPYLSGGDSRRPVYELDAAVWVCRRTLDVPRPPARSEPSPA